MFLIQLITKTVADKYGCTARCVRDSSVKPRATQWRGLEADSPTRTGGLRTTTLVKAELQFKSIDSKEYLITNSDVKKLLEIFLQRTGNG